MEIKVIASSSAGNGYTVSDGRTTVLLEAGLTIDALKKATGYKLSTMAACLLSHEHGDHAKSAQAILDMGIDLYTSAGTAMALDLRGHNLKLVKDLDERWIGTFDTKFIALRHNVVEPLGWIMASRITGEKLLFATDTHYILDRVPGLTHVMIECNYSRNILTSNVSKGTLHPAQKTSLIERHMSLERVIKFFEDNDKTRLQEVWLMHLSNRNSDEAYFKSEIQKVTGCAVYVC